jgi:hypothetical protein
VSAAAAALPSAASIIHLTLLLSRRLCSLSATHIGDLVTALPSFNLTDLPFKVYSGYLTVPGPFEETSYDSLSIHYQLHTSQNDQSTDPLVTWHQGGPGGSSINVGLYTEMGYFQLSDQGAYVNKNAWNQAANMLYLESPAGSGQGSGYSECISGGKPVRCHWDDVSQGEAYAHTLAAFRKAFPEIKGDLYLTGESYFGQYGPNIANWILNHAPFNATLGLKGIAAGNACWGGDATHVNCNGPNEDQIDIDLYFGKALISRKLYESIYSACGWSSTISTATATTTSAATASEDDGLQCDVLLTKAHAAVGPHNVYNLYDNCPGFDAALGDALAASGRSMRWLTKELRGLLIPGTHPSSALLEVERAVKASMPLPKSSVAVAASGTSHLKQPGRSGFGYSTSGPASVTLWPFLSRHLRVLIYNGDADSCVPYAGNVQWISELEKNGDLTEKAGWRPWFTASKGGNARGAPAGYVTTYNVPSQPALDFSFLTIRLAGHMVPTFQPAASLAFFERFLAAEPF